MKRYLSRRRVSRRSLLAGAGAVTAGSLLAACSSNGGSGSSDLSEHQVGAMDDYGVGDQFRASEPVEFSILMQDHPGYPHDPDWLFWSELAERTNVTLENVIVPLADYNERRGVMIAGGDAPMILPRTYPPDEEQFIAGGAILPVSDYFDLMPHFQEKVARWNLDADLDTRRQDDGKIYVLPGLHENVWIDYSLAMRTDILDELDLDEPTTWDEVADVLREMRRAYPDRYPFSDRWSTPPQPGANNLLAMVSDGFGTYAGWAWQPTYFDRNANRFVFPAAMDEYRQVLEYLNMLVREELIDPESFTQSDDEAIEKFASGRSFVISANAQTVIEHREDLEGLAGATVRKVRRPRGPMGHLVHNDRLENGIMISSRARESENFVAMMQFIDWLWYSDEGKMFAKWGIEGETYTGSVEDGSFELADDVDWAGLNPDADQLLNADYGFFNGIFVYGGSTELLHSQFTEEEQEFQETLADIEGIAGPPRPLNPQEREQASLMETGLRDYTDQETLKFILGQRSFDEWDSFIEELRGRNMDQYLDIVNGAYERYQEEHG
ncbi:extracellular solute-binding protein [Natronosporangium hydrolyticum]|uniref:Extracellular solute-binding protein n=1 Tax=Natronosporangium hydrolyticum TaxID=2811111 RepID=A0A895YM13_9ACTN|nr:extracellular solute-binding protein [Natronosporangium hydrolyticum]QSB16519.1 extracellular solute-binding protein [Natronosporangium hydrolyticum]